MVEETKKWGVVILVLVTILSLLFGLLSSVKAKKAYSMLGDEQQKRVAIENKVRELEATVKQATKDAQDLMAKNKTLMAENKKLKAELSKAKKEIDYLKNELEKLNRLKETLEENLKNALMVLPEDKKQEIAAQPQPAQ